MREQINEKDLETVVGGIVRVSGNRMQVAFTTRREVFRLKPGCDPDEAALQAQILYSQHKNEGDLAYETIVKQEFEKNGWI
jgi:hypothetical protein